MDNLDKSRKIIVIIGAQGFIGSALRQRFLKSGYSVVAAGRRHGDAYEQPYNQHTVDSQLSLRDFYYRLDIGDAAQVDRFCNLLSNQHEIECIYNCAAEFGRYNGEDFFNTLWNSNVVGLKNLLHYLPFNVKKFIHFSSSEVYGDTDLVMTEDLLDKHPIRQLNDYAMTKRVNEMQIRNFVDTNRGMYHTRFTCVRLFNIYGATEPYSPYRSALRRWVHCLLNKKPITVYSYHKRSWMHINDAIELLVSIGLSAKHHDIVNVASHEAYFMKAIASLLVCDMFSKTGYSKSYEHETQTTIIKNVDNSLAVKEYGLQCKVSLIDGLIQTIVNVAQGCDYPMAIPCQQVEKIEQMDRGYLLNRLLQYEHTAKQETGKL